MTDLREDVRAAVAASLPEFLRRNAVRVAEGPSRPLSLLAFVETNVREPTPLTREQAEAAAALPDPFPGGSLRADVLENLSWWLTGAVPSGVYRVACGANESGIACACTGQCQTWLPVPGAHCTCPFPYGGKGGERFTHLSRCAFSATSMRAAGRG